MEREVHFLRRAAGHRPGGEGDLRAGAGVDPAGGEGDRERGLLRQGCGGLRAAGPGGGRQGTGGLPRGDPMGRGYPEKAGNRNRGRQTVHPELHGDPGQLRAERFPAGDRGPDPHPDRPDHPRGAGADPLARRIRPDGQPADLHHRRDPDQRRDQGPADGPGDGDAGQPGLHRGCT